MSWQYPLGIVLEHMGDAAVVALAHGLKHCCVAKAVYSGRVCAGFQKHFHGVLQAGISQTKWARAWGQESAQHAPICTTSPSAAAVRRREGCWPSATRRREPRSSANMVHCATSRHRQGSSAKRGALHRCCQLSDTDEKGTTEDHFQQGHDPNGRSNGTLHLLARHARTGLPVDKRHTALAAELLSAANQ
eukprot:1162053-Pelagomonas_calceolata.AAC.4